MYEVKCFAKIKYKAKNFWDTMFYEKLTEEYLHRDLRTRTFVSLFLSAVCPITGTMNFLRGQYFLAVTNIFLMAAFLFCAFTTGILKNRTISPVIISIINVVVFSIYALIGGNRGFSILWITLMPFFTMMVQGFKIGFLVSAYFQIFLVTIFYSPIRKRLALYYTEEFMSRYPILYFAGFVMAIFVVYRTLYYQKRVEETARTDILTGLGNRLFFNEKIDELLAVNDRANVISKLTFFVFDVDRLKFVNDNFGHGAGDEIIRATADCIKQAFPNAEILARVGGDEFYMVLVDAENLESLKENFLRIVSDWRGEKVASLSVACGYAQTSDDSRDIEAIQKLADDAMYAHKGTLRR